MNQSNKVKISHLKNNWTDVKVRRKIFSLTSSLLKWNKTQIEDRIKNVFNLIQWVTPDSLVLDEKFLKWWKFTPFYDKFKGKSITELKELLLSDENVFNEKPEEGVAVRDEKITAYLNGE